MKIILSDIWPEIVLVIIIAVAMMMNGCSVVPHAIREQTWPLEMAIFGKVEPWGYGDELIQRLPCEDDE